MRTLIIGDVHGCLHELKALLELADYRKESERLIFVGDLISRGPDSFGVLEFVNELCADCLMGNHERSFLSFLKKGTKSSRSFQILKKSMGDNVTFWKHWMEDLPLFIRSADPDAEDAFLVVHAGLVPNQAPEDTEASILTNIRTWDFEKSQLGVSCHPAWFEYYREPQTVIFGHWAARGVVMRPNVIGIDSGCVYGGFLSAISLPDRTLYQFPAKNVYQQTS